MKLIGLYLTKELMFPLLLIGVSREGMRVSPLNPVLSQSACFPDINNNNNNNTLLFKC